MPLPRRRTLTEPVTAALNQPPGVDSAKIDLRKSPKLMGECMLRFTAHPPGKKPSLYSRSDRDPSMLTESGRTDLIAPQVRAFGGNVIHSIANLLPKPSAGIHVYLGDLHAQKRSMWNLDLEGERPFDMDYYFRWARSLDYDKQSVA
jgi:hypothetical protein